MSDFKIDPEKCIFALDGRSVSNLVAEFKVTHGRFPGLKMILCDRLDEFTGLSILVEASGVDPKNVMLMARDELRALVPAGSFYDFRTNDVIFYMGELDQQTIIYSCCGHFDLTGK